LLCTWTALSDGWLACRNAAGVRRNPWNPAAALIDKAATIKGKKSAKKKALLKKPYAFFPL
jgi:hypothetical protein